MSATSEGREERMRDMVGELESLAAGARDHVAVMERAVAESINWSDPADVNWAREALTEAIAAAADADRDLKLAHAIVEELFA